MNALRINKIASINFLFRCIMLKSRLLMSMLSLILLFLFPTKANTQETEGEEVIHKKFRELHISPFIGISFWGPKNDMEDNMLSSGLGDLYDGWLGRINYPVSSRQAVYDFETTLYFVQQHGISINAAIADNISVSGFDNIGIGNNMGLNSKIVSYSLNYAYRTNDERLNLFFGPSYIIHRIYQETGSTKTEESNFKKFGLYFGISVHIIEREKWFLALKSNLRLAPKSEIGPYTKEHQTGIATENPETYTSVYNQVNVNLNSINLGIAIGFKFEN